MFWVAQDAEKSIKLSKNSRISDDRKNSRPVEHSTWTPSEHWMTVKSSGSASIKPFTSSLSIKIFLNCLETCSSCIGTSSNQSAISCKIYSAFLQVQKTNRRRFIYAVVFARKMGRVQARIRDGSRVGVHQGFREVEQFGNRCVENCSIKRTTAETVPVENSLVWHGILSFVNFLLDHEHLVQLVRHLAF